MEPFKLPNVHAKWPKSGPRAKMVKFWNILKSTKNIVPGLIFDVDFIFHTYTRMLNAENGSKTKIVPDTRISKNEIWFLANLRH